MSITITLEEQTDGEPKRHVFDGNDTPRVKFGRSLYGEGVRLSDLESHLIRQALRRTGGSLGPAARLLGISYKTLQYRIRKHGLN